MSWHPGPESSHGYFQQLLILISMQVATLYFLNVRVFQVVGLALQLLKLLPPCRSNSRIPLSWIQVFLSRFFFVSSSLVSRCHQFFLSNPKSKIHILDIRVPFLFALAERLPQNIVLSSRLHLAEIFSKSIDRTKKVRPNHGRLGLIDG